MNFERHPNTEKGLEDLRQMIGGAFNKTKNQFGEMRKAASIFNASPLGLAVSEIVFPRGVADGTLEGALKLNGPSAVNREPTNTYDPTL